MEREHSDIDEIHVIIDIRSYMFEHLVLNNNEESEPEADGYSGRLINGTIWYDKSLNIHYSMNILSLHLIQSFLFTYLYI